MCHRHPVNYASRPDNTAPHHQKKLSPMTSRPNVLFFICDQLRADHLGCYGNRTVRTPAIDKIAARGVAFDHFYVASPVCQPNRATLATGRMPSLHGVRINGISLSLTANTFIEMLRAQQLADRADRQEPPAEFRRRAARR